MLNGVVKCQLPRSRAKPEWRQTFALAPREALAQEPDIEDNAVRRGVHCQHHLSLPHAIFCHTLPLVTLALREGKYRNTTLIFIQNNSIYSYLLSCLGNLHKCYKATNTPCWSFHGQTRLGLEVQGTGNITWARPGIFCFLSLEDTILLSTCKAGEEMFAMN